MGEDPVEDEATDASVEPRPLSLHGWLKEASAGGVSGGPREVFVDTGYLLALERRRADQNHQRRRLSIGDRSGKDEAASSW